MKTKVVVAITDMEQPLGRAIGNALEIRECIDFLHGRTPEDLETVSIALAAQMVRLGGRARTLDQATKLAYEAVSKGEAADRFRKIVAAHGGDARVLDDPSLLPTSHNVEELRATSTGFITRCDAKLLGLASNALGSGRNRIDDRIEPAAGIFLQKKLGDPVTRGDILCQVHCNDDVRLQEGLKLIRQAFQIDARPAKKPPLIHALLEG
jgi:thymidine phosphorylase